MAHQIHKQVRGPIMDKIIADLAALPLIVRGSPDDVFKAIRELQEAARKSNPAASTVAPQQSDGWPSEAASKIADYFNAPPSVIPAIERIIQRCAAPAPSAAIQDETTLSGPLDSERLRRQEGKPMKNYDDFRAGMLRAAEIARNEFKRAPEAAKGHDSVYMGGYEDACDHLSVAIAQAAVIDCVRIAGSQPDWQYHIALLLPEGIADEALLKIYQVVEHELRTASSSSTHARAAARTIASALERDEVPHHVEESEPFIAAIIERCLSEGEA